MTKEPLRTLAEKIAAAKINGFDKIHLAFDEKDVLLGLRDNLTLSTIHSAKGYDAYCVPLIAAEQFDDVVKDRAVFYVDCTRAIGYLEVTGVGDRGLLKEFSAAAK